MFIHARGSAPKKWKTQCAKFKSNRLEFVRSGGIVVTCLAGDTKVAGSNPASATSFCPQARQFTSRCPVLRMALIAVGPVGQLRALVACVSCN